MIKTTEKEFFKDMFNDILVTDDNVLKFVPGEKGDETEVMSQETAQSLDLKLKGRKAKFLRKVEKALEKLDSDDFGVCEECGDSISFERLKARPTATMCIQCKEEQEKNEGPTGHRKNIKLVYNSKLSHGNADVATANSDEIIKKALIS